jgi:hypothetical protein
MRNRAAILLFASLAVAVAQQPSLDPRTSLKIEFPADSPVTLVSADLGDSATTAQGSAMIIDLHSSLSLRNSASKRIRGVTLLVTAQEVTPGGKASVCVPSLSVGAGETFPVRVNLRLLRPLVPIGPLVVVSLDGVLFDDMSFYGPNRLNSRRTMSVWELEARRDRRHFKSVLEAQGADGLRNAMLESIAQQAARPRIDVQMARGGRATTVEAEHPVRFAFLAVPGSPVEPIIGVAQVSGNQARAPSIEVRNRGDRAVRYFELGWIVSDAAGREYLAGSVPASDPNLRLAPGQKSQVVQDGSLRFLSAPGRPLNISGIKGFVSQVEYVDGSIWIPARAALSDPTLSRVMVPSPEEQRLTEIYRRRGLAAVTAELRKLE